MPQASARSLFRNILQSSSLYTLASIAQRMMGVALVPINTRYLTPGDYGVLDLIEQTFVLLSVLLGGGFASALGYFYFSLEDANERRKVVATTMLGSALLGVLAGIVTWFAATLLSRTVLGDSSYSIYLRIGAIAITFSFLLEAGFSWLRVEDRVPLFAGFTLARVGMVVSGTVILLSVFKLGLMGVVATNSGAIIVLGAAIAIICLRACPLEFDRPLFGRMLRYSIPLGFGGLAMFVIHFGDRFLLPHYRSLTELGRYSLAYKGGMLISLLAASFHSYWSSQIYQIVRRDDAAAVMARAFTYMMLAVSGCAVALIAFARPMFALVTAPAFHSASDLVPLLVAAYWVRTIGDFFRVLFLVEGRPDYDAACNWIGAVVCLGGYILLIPPFGAWGAAAATMIAFLTIGIVIIIWTYRLRPYRIEGWRLAKIGVVTLALAAAALAVRLPAWPQLIWATLMVLAYPLLLWALRFPTQSERQAPHLLWNAARVHLARFGIA